MALSRHILPEFIYTHPLSSFDIDCSQCPDRHSVQIGTDRPEEEVVVEDRLGIRLW